MKYFMIFLVLLSIATLIPHTMGSGHNQDIGFFYLPLNTESKEHSILAQSTSANFVNSFYDSSLNSLLASISGVNSEDIGAITMTNQTYWELFAESGERYVGGIQLLIDGEAKPYKKIKDYKTVTYLFKIPPNSTQVEIVPSTLRMGVTTYPELETLSKTFPKTYPPLKQEHIGIPVNEIHCNDGLTLFHKYDGSPVCITPETVPKLVERGWTENTHNECKTKVIPSEFKLKKNTWLSIAQLSQDKVRWHCTIITEDTISRATFLKNAIDGADGCNNDLIYCGGGRVTLERVYNFGISLSDTLDYELSLNPDQAESLLKQVKLTSTDDLAYGTIKHNDTYYQIILHTTDSDIGAQTRGEFESVPANPVPLQKGTFVNFTYSVESFATFGSPARINLTSNNPARDSGLEIHAVPPILEIPERAQKNATIIVSADNDAKDGIYQIRVSGRDADSGGLIRTDLLPDNPKVNVGNSSWEIFTYGNDRGSAFSGATPPPKWAWAELELNQDVFYENDTMEIRAYLVNNGTEPLVIDESELLIQIIKATSDGYYSNLYGIDAKLADGETIVVEPKSKQLIVRPFLWDQMTFNQNDEPYRVDPAERKIMMTLGHYNGSVWRDQVSFVMK